MDLQELEQTVEVEEKDPELLYFAEVDKWSQEEWDHLEAEAKKLVLLLSRPFPEVKSWRKGLREAVCNIAAFKPEKRSHKKKVGF